MAMTQMDVFVGRRIRERRWLLGLSQDKLARAIGLKFQQIQKYETGGAKISAGRLFLLAEALDVPVSYFFDGLDPTAAQVAASAEAESAHGSELEPLEPNSVRECGEIMRLAGVLDASQRHSVLALLRAVTATDSDVLDEMPRRVRA